MLERKTLSVRGILISYLVSPGEAGKTPFLFLHGWRAEAALWKNAMERLNAEGFPVYAPDLPGFGASGLPPRAFSVADYADVVEEFAKKLEIGSAVVVGHSFGGRIGIVLSVRCPASVAKLVLVNSAGIRAASPRRALAAGAAKLAKPLFAYGFMQSIRGAFYTALGAGDYLATPQLRETFKRIIAEDLSPFLPNIGQETLLVWGAKDADTPLSFARIMEKEIPKSRLEVFANAGHFSFLDEPEQFASLLGAFAKSAVSAHLRL